MALDVTPNSDGFGAKLNRTVSLPEWEQMIASTQAEVKEALNAFGFLEGRVWPFLATDTFQEQLLRWSSMFLHRDRPLRLMVTPKGGRKEGTWLLPDEDYTEAQRAGLTALVESEGLSVETRQALERKRDKLGTGYAENIPVNIGIVADRGFNYQHVKGYQAALLQAKGPRAKRISWDDGGILTKKLVIMCPRLPHMREVSSPLDFSVGSSVGYADAQS